MSELERLDRQAGSLAALEGALALLVEHAAKAGLLSKGAYITDLKRLKDQPGTDANVRTAEERLLRMLAVLG